MSVRFSSGERVGMQTVFFTAFDLFQRCCLIKFAHQVRGAYHGRHTTVPLTG